MIAGPPGQVGVTSARRAIAAAAASGTCRPTEVAATAMAPVPVCRPLPRGPQSIYRLRLRSAACCLSSSVLLRLLLVFNNQNSTSAPRTAPRRAALTKVAQLAARPASSSCKVQPGALWRDKACGSAPSSTHNLPPARSECNNAPTRALAWISCSVAAGWRLGVARPTHRATVMRALISFSCEASETGGLGALI